jgi:CubicO group peptidase (beta-lactamase class C family)
MQLVESGKLKVEDSVVSILPDFPFGDKIKVKHLLTHTSGTYNYFAHPDFRCKRFTIRGVSDALPLIYDQKLRFETPGEQYFYSNSGIVILGAIIEKLSGKHYADYIRDHILIPADMNDTGINYLEDVIENRAVGYTQSITGKFQRNIFSVPPANSDGGIETTVLDLLKYDQVLYGELLLKEESKKIMFTPYKNDYAFCWGIEQLFNNTIISHSGGAPGVSAVFRRYINDRYTLIVLSNYSGGAPPVANAIEAIIFNVDFKQPKPRLGNYLYEITKQKGKDYLAENFNQILKEGNYKIRSSNLLNMIGYTFLQENLPETAIQVFKINTRLFPNEANPYDSLAEAYLMSGDLTQSKENYKKALQIDPEFENAQRMLKRIEVMEKN